MAVHNQSAAAPFDDPGRGVVLICDQAGARSSLIDKDRREGDAAQTYIALFSGILARSEFNVVFHRAGQDLDQSATVAAIEGWRRQLPVDDAPRFEVIDAAPLDALLNSVDLLVSFASPALVLGCRSGLKPVQIGRAIIGSAGFTHFFADPDGFLGALASGGLRAGLTLEEYSEFERFADALCAGQAAGSARGDDPILGGFQRTDGRWLSLIQAIGDILANPIGALRLLFGTVAGLLRGGS